MSGSPVTVVTSLYRGARYLRGYLDGLSAQTIPERLQVAVVHNDPLPEDVEIIESFRRERPDIRLIHLQVPLEGLYESWNRAVRETNGDYLAIWNVDDVRMPDSLERQAALLDSDPSLVATYGDMVFVRSPGAVEGTRKTYPEFDRELFTRECVTGPFLMWRRRVHGRAGPFDEQFRVAGDFDMWVRIAARGDMRKCSGVHGTFLYEGRGLSTVGDGLQPLERTAVELRYGVTERLDYRFVGEARRRFDLAHVHAGGERVPVRSLFPGYGKRMEQGRRNRARGVARHVRKRIGRVLLAPRMALRRLRERLRAGGGGGC